MGNSVRPIKQTSISTTALATAANPIAAAASVSTKLNTGFPTGDALLHALHFRYSGNLNLAAPAPAGVPIANGGLMNVRSIYLSTPQHGQIVSAVDGLTLHNLEYLRRGVRPLAADIGAAGAGTPTFDYQFNLNFREKEAVQPELTSLDMQRVSYMELQINTAGATDFISGGAYGTETIQALNLDIHASINSGPISDAADLPAFRPYKEQIRIPINQTQVQFQVFLPYGGRLIERYFVQQRSGATLLELGNTIIGVNDQDRIEFQVGGYPWMHRIEWLHLQAKNVSDFRLNGAMPTGSVCVTWVELDSAGVMASELLGLNNASGAAPLTEMDFDATAVANGQVWITTEGRTLPPIDAVRQATVKAA